MAKYLMVNKGNTILRIDRIVKFEKDLAGKMEKPWLAHLIDKSGIRLSAEEVAKITQMQIKDEKKEIPSPAQESVSGALTSADLSPG